MARRLDHPVLGLLKAEKWEWQVQREVAIPCTGYATKHISIAEASAAGPSPQQLQALVNVVKSPASFRDEIAKAVFRAYVDEIRSEYFEMLSDTRDDYGVTVDSLPDVKEPNNIWSFVTGLHSVWVAEDASVDVQFSVTFDEEHQLHVRLNEGSVGRTWME